MATFQRADQLLLYPAPARVRFAWVAGDEVYGLGSKLRKACEKDREGYVLAVPANCTVTLSSGRKAAVSAVARLIPPAAWETHLYGTACKGTLHTLVRVQSGVKPAGPVRLSLVTGGGPDRRTVPRKGGDGTAPGWPGRREMRLMAVVSGCDRGTRHGSR